MVAAASRRCSLENKCGDGWLIAAVNNAIILLDGKTGATIWLIPTNLFFVWTLRKLSFEVAFQE